METGKMIRSKAPAKSRAKRINIPYRSMLRYVSSIPRGKIP